MIDIMVNFRMKNVENDYENGLERDVKVSCNFTSVLVG